jgi:hypothetical protein
MGVDVLLNHEVASSMSPYRKRGLSGKDEMVCSLERLEDLERFCVVQMLGVRPSRVTKGNTARILTSAQAD